MGQFDPDYPFVQDSHRNVNNSLYDQRCSICDGGIWKNPAISIEEMLRLVSQVNSMKELPGDMKLQIREYGLEERCGEIQRQNDSASALGMSSSEYLAAVAAKDERILPLNSSNSAV